MISDTKIGYYSFADFFLKYFICSLIIYLVISFSVGTFFRLAISIALSPRPRHQ